MNFILGVCFVIGLLISYRLGYEVAHSTIARECDRLGSFYVGDKTYHCTEIKEAGSATDSARDK